MIKRIVILGSTGVLGSKLLSFLKKNNLKVSLITCFSNYKKLLKQKKYIGSNRAIVLDNNITIKCDELDFGEMFLIKHIKEKPINLLYVLNIGFDSLKYIDLVIKFQKNCTLAIANKEIIVAGGHILINKILKSGNKVLPLDSEHFSLINHFPERNLIKNYISKIYLTASGGPFYFNKNFNINNINLNKATSHPLWKMGFKNSIDSSNLVNKVLECFELSSLYNFPLSKIGITILPKGFAHSLVFYKDQRISINCFNNDMMIPLTSPFSYKTVLNSPPTSIKIFENKDLNFKAFGNNKFQILKYYDKLLTFNHVQQINFMILNAEAVKRFILKDLKYVDIIPFIFNNINSFPKTKKFKDLYEIINYTNKISFKISKL